MGNANEWADCSGQITTTFEWQPDGPGDDPPKKVVISESCSVSWFGYDVSSPATGVADNGLGFAEVSNGPVPIYDGSGNLEYWEGGGDASGTRYRIEAGKQTMTVTCSPQASADGGSGGYAEVSLFYGVNVEPLEVNLAGGIGRGNAKRYLIGQQVGATLNSGGLTVTSYNWSVSGGEPFKTWTANNTMAMLTHLGSETGSQLDFHFKIPATGTVACAVHLAVPSGAMPAGGFDVTPDRQCSVERPDSASISVYIGTVTPIPAGGPFGFVQLQRFYYYPPDPAAAGIEHEGQVTIPLAFVTAYGGDTGAWNWTQLITPFDQRKRNGVWKLLALSLPPPANPPYRIIYGVQCLDNAYPYGGFWYMADGTLDGNADSPYEALESDPLITAKDILDSFDCWFMYQPPGTDSVAVPLKKVEWYWEFHAVKSSGLWSVSGMNAQWSFNGDYPLHPEWSFSLSNGGLEYEAP